MKDAAAKPTGVGALKRNQPTPFLEPFWLVRADENIKAVNMVLKNIKVDEKMSVPVLTNSVAVKAGCELVALKVEVRKPELVRPSAPAKPEAGQVKKPRTGFTE